MIAKPDILSLLCKVEILIKKLFQKNSIYLAANQARTTVFPLGMTNPLLQCQLVFGEYTTVHQCRCAGMQTILSDNCHLQSLFSCLPQPSRLNLLY